MMAAATMTSTIKIALKLSALLSLTACNASSSGGDVQSFAAKSAPILRVCSGYGCVYKEKFQFTDTENAELRTIFSGVENAEEERARVSKAIGVMERMARHHLRYRPDKRLAEFKRSGTRGEMDCVDESLNTTGYLYYLHEQKLLRHHQPKKNYAERGFLLDGRYPHKSAVMTDTGTNIKWAVDSWKENDGNPAQVITLSSWYKERPSAYR